MKITGTFLGSGGVELVHLPTIIAQAFEVSRSEARRLLVMDGVRIDEEVCNRIDIPVDELRGRELKIGKRRSVELS